MLRDGVISIVPIAFMRGRTFVDSFIIVDEFQNISKQDISLVLSRLGKCSKMVLCGDTDQIDLRKHTDSCIHLFNDVSKLKDVERVDLKTNHRHSVLDELLTYIKERVNNDK